MYLRWGYFLNDILPWFPNWRLCWPVLRPALRGCICCCNNRSTGLAHFLETQYPVFKRSVADCSFVIHCKYSRQFIFWTEVYIETSINLEALIEDYIGIIFLGGPGILQDAPKAVLASVLKDSNWFLVGKSAGKLLCAIVKPKPIRAATLGKYKNLSDGLGIETQPICTFRKFLQEHLLYLPGSNRQPILPAVRE